MKVAVVGSRNHLVMNLGDYLPEECDEIVSGGARGLDSCAAAYARKNNIKLTEVLPDYEKHGKNAPLIRNRQIVDYADMLIAFWDGKSGGTRFTINYARMLGMPIKIVPR